MPSEHLRYFLHHRFGEYRQLPQRGDREIEVPQRLSDRQSAGYGRAREDEHGQIQWIRQAYLHFRIGQLRPLALQ
ncbi:hypothetical protein ACW2Q0_14135 [Nocardia sp. R16R-3T]